MNLEQQCATEMVASPCMHLKKKNKQAAMPMSRTDQRRQLLFFQLQEKRQTLLNCWMPPSVYSYVVYFTAMMSKIDHSGI